MADAERRQREEVAALEVEAQKAEARLQARRAKAQSLPDEPAQGSADACRVVVKLPDGQRLDRRFPTTCHLQAVVDWVESASPEIFDFTFVSNYPRRHSTAAPSCLARRACVDAHRFPCACTGSFPRPSSSSRLSVTSGWRAKRCSSPRTSLRSSEGPHRRSLGTGRGRPKGEE